MPPWKKMGKTSLRYEACAIPVGDLPHRGTFTLLRNDQARVQFEDGESDADILVVVDRKSVYFNCELSPDEVIAYNLTKGCLQPINAQDLARPVESVGDLAFRYS